MSEEKIDYSNMLHRISLLEETANFLSEQLEQARNEFQEFKESVSERCTYVEQRIQTEPKRKPGRPWGSRTTTPKPTIKDKVNDFFAPFAEELFPGKVNSTQVYLTYELYALYQAWCRRRGYNDGIESAKTFGRCVAFYSKNVNPRWKYLGRWEDGRGVQLPEINSALWVDEALKDFYRSDPRYAKQTEKLVSAMQKVDQIAKDAKRRQERIQKKQERLDKRWQPRAKANKPEPENTELSIEEINHRARLRGMAVNPSLACAGASDEEIVRLIKESGLAEPKLLLEADESPKTVGFGHVVDEVTPNE